MPSSITLLTGPGGSGKTTLCRELAASAAAAGREVAGLVSPARLEHGCKIGIDALDLRSGEVRPLARRPAPVAGAPPRPWTFDEATLAWGDALLVAAIPVSLLVVDELGPLEWREGRGWFSGLAVVDSGAFDHAVAVVRPSLIPLATARWPEAEVIQATEEDARRRMAAFLPEFPSPWAAPR